MFAAVWWLQAKSWSIVETRTIFGDGDLTAGCFAYAQHKEKLFEVKIIRLAGMGSFFLC